MDELAQAGEKGKNSPSVISWGGCETLKRIANIN